MPLPYALGLWINAPFQMFISALTAKLSSLLLPLLGFIFFITAVVLGNEKFQLCICLPQLKCKVHEARALYFHHYTPSFYNSELCWLVPVIFVGDS